MQNSLTIVFANETSQMIQHCPVKSVITLPTILTKLAKDIIGILEDLRLDVLVWPANVHAIRQAAKYMKDNSDDMRELSDLINKVLQCATAGRDFHHRITQPNFL